MLGGLSTNYDLSIEDLVDLLHSVDHEKVVDCKDAVISDQALEALLDRTLQGSSKAKSDPSSFREEQGGEDSLKSASSAAAHADVFKVIAERDSDGKLLVNGEEAGVKPAEPGGGGVKPVKPGEGSVQPDEAREGDEGEMEGSVEQQSGGGGEGGKGGEESMEVVGVEAKTKHDTAPDSSSATPEPHSEHSLGSASISPTPSSSSSASSPSSCSTGASEEGQGSGATGHGVVVTDSTVDVCVGEREGGREPETGSGPGPVMLSSK